MWAIVGTWPFSLAGCEAAKPLLASGEGALSALLAAGTWVEDDLSVDSVGTGGLPNRDGEVELDAAVMSGTDFSLGAVAGVKRVKHALRLANDVRLHTEHTFLVGEGAERFARTMGYPVDELTTAESRLRWAEMRKEAEAKVGGHDTVGFIALDEGGHLFVGVSTSGMRMKLPGRVGDSPIIGGGYYVDDEVGGAAATGLGEDIMRGCTCFRAVELMRAGKSPKEAAEGAVKATLHMLTSRGRKVGNMAVVCLDKRGNAGAGASFDGFEYSYAASGVAPARHPVSMTP